MRPSSLFLLVIILLLVGCTQALPNPGAREVNATLTAQASLTPPAEILTMEAGGYPAPDTVTVKVITTSIATATAKAVAKATDVGKPSATPVLHPTSTPTPRRLLDSPYPADTAAELPLLDRSGSGDLHGLILFRSIEGLPFTYAPYGEGDFGYQGPLSRGCSLGINCLWAVSPDGKRAGRLNPDGFDFEMILLPGGAPLAVENGFVLNQPLIQSVQLPAVCPQTPDSKEQPCDRIGLSPDGRYLAFRYGPDNCGRSMQLIDRQTGEVILEREGGVHSVGFMPNGKFSMSAGHCEGSATSFFDPSTHQKMSGGPVGNVRWNQARTLFVETAESYIGNTQELWGYRLDIGTSFYPEDKTGWRYDDKVIFLPDDRRFIYQHLQYGFDQKQSTNRIDTPAQIVRYDPISGERTVLASDPAYHYRLCQFDYEQPCALQWYGDWIQVQRVPFTAISPKGYDWSLHSELPCFAEAQRCKVPPESFALNARTGELRPWDPTALPLTYPTPTPTLGPDLQGSPVYTDPAGQFALYIGADKKSLWRVPKTGPAVMWVMQGYDFFYLP